MLDVLVVVDVDEVDFVLLVEVKDEDLCNVEPVDVELVDFFDRLGFFGESDGEELEEELDFRSGRSGGVLFSVEL